MSAHAGPDIVTDELVVYLDAANPKSYAGSGSVWYDNLKGNSATLISAPVFSAEGNGSFLINTTDYATLPFDDTLITNSDHTILCWCKCNDTLTTANADRVTVYKDQITNAWDPGLWYHSETIRVHTNGKYTDVTWTQDQEWHMMGQVFVDSGDDIKVVLDDSILSGTGTVYSPGAPTGIMHIGNRGDTGTGVSQYRGYISTFMIYTRALSATEIAQNYDTMKNRFI
jgi:hypothetical protein